MQNIDLYTPIVGRPVIDDLRLLGERLAGKVIQHVNSTAVGGGVAEILTRMVPLLRELGVDTRWDVIKGGERFFAVTKKFHNVLHGRADSVTRQDFYEFMETGQKNVEDMETYGDVVFIHDPQPVMLVKKRRDNRWLWRCHIDVSNPDQAVWKFLRRFVVQYDAAVFSAPSFSQRLPIPQYLIAPSIDPLADKNRELAPETIHELLDKYQVPTDKPLVTQISRFDRLKDPLGVIEAYRLVKKYNDCRLVLAGGGASDDPECAQVL